ncbi:MAG: EAL domain-containing protein [Actinomycetota bacterium]|nr:EAL domain-containing protein [Actinomycetota bacterium]
MRWQHPLYGLLPPAEFIPLAEQTGLIPHIGRWVLEEACGQVRRWQDEHGGDPALTLNVNVSAVQFRQPNLVQEVLRTLKRRGLAAHDLKLEITESVMMHDASSVTALRELKAMGIKVAMDDFGTGYSSLSYLKRFPVDTLKIDRLYVEGLGSDAGDTAIVHATVAFAKSLNLDSPRRISREQTNWSGCGIWGASSDRATTSRNLSRVRRQHGSSPPTSPGNSRPRVDTRIRTRTARARNFYTAHAPAGARTT